MYSIFKYTSAMAFVVILLVACKGEKQPTMPSRTVETVNAETGILALRDYTYTDTITIAGQPYSYTYTLEHVDTMPVLMNAQGTEYYESRVRIAIQKGNTTFFSKTFYKNDFRGLVPSDFLKTSTMVGVTYNFTKRDEDRSAFYFIVTVGDPDETSDMAYPLEFKVAPDGSTSMKKAENLETEPLNPGLNIDPSEDAV